MNGWGEEKETGERRGGGREDKGGRGWPKGETFKGNCIIEIRGTATAGGTGQDKTSGVPNYLSMKHVWYHLPSRVYSDGLYLYVLFDVGGRDHD